MTVTTEEKRETSRLYFFKDLVEKEIAKALGSFGEKNKLRDACEYALKSGGKRIRPLLVFLVADGLGHGLDVAQAALAAEFFHTASLIADDLPCMDNDDERRESPSLHKVYGETIAILSSYALITAGFEWLTKNGQTMRLSPAPFSQRADRVTTIVLSGAARSSGISGATGGQFRDLFPPNGGFETLKQTICQKSVTLFEVAFVCGWLFGGGDVPFVCKVKEMAYHFGMAFQIADDLDDVKKDGDKKHDMNAALILGKERARTLFEQELSLFKKGAKELNMWTPSFEKLTGLLSSTLQLF